MGNLCLIYNSAPHYRKGIFELIDRRWDCIWAVGSLKNIKDLDITGFRGEKVKLKNRWLKGNFYWQKGALRLAFRRDVDSYLMLGDSYCLSSWLVAAIARLRGKEVVMWSHGWLRMKRFPKNVVSRLFFHLPQRMLIYNNRSRELMQRHGVGCRELITVYNSLDYDRQLEIRKRIRPTDIYRRHFGNAAPVIVFIGRLTHVKRLDQLIEALDVLRREYNQDCNLVLIGDGEAGEELRQMVSNRGLEDRVWFYGASYDEEQNAQLIADADLCVAPGNIGLTAMHVMMFGTPAATHNDFDWQMPEYEAIKEGETGFFFRRNDVNSIAEGVSRWLREKSSERETIRKACQAEIDEHWNPHIQIEIINKALIFNNSRKGMKINKLPPPPPTPKS